MSKVMESQEPGTRTGKAFSGHWKEKGMQAVFFIAACTSILAVALICIFLFANGLPAIAEIGPLDFLLVKPGGLPMIYMESFPLSWEVFM